MLVWWNLQMNCWYHVFSFAMNGVARFHCCACRICWFQISIFPWISHDCLAKLQSQHLTDSHVFYLMQCLFHSKSFVMMQILDPMNSLLEVCQLNSSQSLCNKSFNKLVCRHYLKFDRPAVFVHSELLSFIIVFKFIFLLRFKKSSICKS